MEEHRNRHLSLFYYFISNLLVPSIKSQQTTPVSTNASYYYNLCAPSTCNNLTLVYPFTLPTPCHPSRYEIHCPNNQFLVIKSPRASDGYRIFSLDFVDSTTTNLFGATDTLFTCGSHISQTNYADDATSFSLSLNFAYGTHFNCTAPIPSNSVRGLQNASCLGCDGQDGSNVCYYAPGIITAPSCETYHMFTPGPIFNASGVRDLRGFLQSGYVIRYNKPFECQGCEASGGRCGANPSTGSFVCFCPSSVHRMNCSDGMIEDLSKWVNGRQSKGSGPSRVVLAAIAASASLLIVGALVASSVIFVRRRYLSMETISSLSSTRYSFSQIKKFTNNFLTKLGEGGFGSVYKGMIHQSGAEIRVAVKILKKSSQTEKQFMNEVVTIGNVHHHNLVSLLGYCVEGETHALVYEFMENGSLDKYIYNIKYGKDRVEEESKSDRKRLTLKQTYSIALETARGLLYLHKGCTKKILHCDVKPPNILLDSNLSAKVADFGLARMIDRNHSHVSLTGAQGTPGYSAPEMWLKSLGPVTDKSDVYGYGMLLLEMVGRRKNYDAEASSSSQVYFPEWIYDRAVRDGFPVLVRDGNIDDYFEIVGDENDRNEEDEKAVQRMCLVGLWCIQYIPSYRPSMDRVVLMLEGQVEIDVPPRLFPTNHTLNP